MILAHTLAVLFIAVSVTAMLAYFLLTAIHLWLEGHAEIKKTQAKKIEQRSSKKLSSELGRIFAMLNTEDA